MVVSNNPISKELDDFLRKYANDVISLKVFLFFVEHPYTQFSETAVISAVGQSREKCNIKKALKNFIEKEVITGSTGHKVTFYYLPENIRNIALEMESLNQSQRYLLMSDLNTGISTWRNDVLQMLLPVVSF
ncbi:MAG: hypothetical protein PHE15_01590 [Dehalococcoidales bacterium]|nr:hypothetical protein [Dehalococcoidales bacterium]